MKRVVAVLLGVVSLAALTGCPATPTPPPLYQRPVVDSVQVAPEPAGPGDVVSLVVEVSDDEIISGAEIGALLTPTGAYYPGPTPCSTSIDQGDDVARAVVTVACSLPSFASNGTWRVGLTIFDVASDGFYPGLRTQLQFQVAGGTEDSSPPTLVEYRTEPSVVDQNSVFTLTARLRDESGPRGNFTANFGVFLRHLTESSGLNCNYPVTTVLSPTEVDIAFTCVPAMGNTSGRAAAGVHTGPIRVVDGLGNQGFTVPVSIDVQPAPPPGSP